MKPNAVFAQAMNGRLVVFGGMALIPAIKFFTEKQDVMLIHQDIEPTTILLDLMDGTTVFFKFENSITVTEFVELYPSIKEGLVSICS